MTEEDNSAIRVYTPLQISVACLIGGPLAAGWLMARNYRVFDDRKKRKLALIYGAVVFCALIAVGWALPKNASGTVFAAVVAILAKEVATRLQGPQVKEFQDKGGRRASWWTVVGVAVAILLVSFGLILIVAVVLTSTQ